jgi:hypothetical protein
VDDAPESNWSAPAAKPSRSPARRSASTRAPPSRSVPAAGCSRFAADGRADDNARLTLAELAEALVALGAVTAINLDGGGATSLVCGGRLRNRPRESHGIELAGGRPVTTALLFTTR